MNRKEFIQHMNNLLDSFEENMKTLNVEQQPLHKWMDTFLRWSEWSDKDMREQYWNEEEG